MVDKTIPDQEADGGEVTLLELGLEGLGITMPLVISPLYMQVAEILILLY